MSSFIPGGRATVNKDGFDAIESPSEDFAVLCGKDEQQFKLWSKSARQVSTVSLAEFTGSRNGGKLQRVAEIAADAIAGSASTKTRQPSGQIHQYKALN